MFWTKKILMKTRYNFDTTLFTLHSSWIHFKRYWPKKLGNKDSHWLKSKRRLGYEKLSNRILYHVFCLHSNLNLVGRSKFEMCNGSTTRCSRKCMQIRVFDFTALFFLSFISSIISSRQNVRLCDADVWWLCDLFAFHLSAQWSSCVKLFCAAVFPALQVSWCLKNNDVCLVVTDWRDDQFQFFLNILF